MSSFRQIEANRRNAQLSTGPATDEVKRRSRQNAIRHGLMANDARRPAIDFVPKSRRRERSRVGLLGGQKTAVASSDAEESRGAPRDMAHSENDD
jgi:hypothetical protein